jgi:MFS family permease
MSSVLAIRLFRRLWLGQAVSQFGDALYALIFLFVVDRLTGSSAMVGYVSALQALPYLLFSPYAGAVADRLDRRIVMLLSDVLSIVILLVLAGCLIATGSAPIPLIFACAFLLASVNVFFAPAKSAAIASLVPADRLMEANSLSAATQNLMPMLGIALSGGLLGAVYRAFPDAFFLSAILINAATFVVSAGAIAGLPSLRPDRDEAKTSVMTDVREGLAYVKGLHVVKVALVLGLLINLFVSPFMVVYVTANRQWFGGDFVTLAAFEFSFVAAMVVGSLVVGRMAIKRVGLAFAFGILVVGLGVAMMAYAPVFWPFLLLNLVCGLALPLAQIPIGTYMQLAVPDAYRGRVNSLAMMLSMGIMPFGMGIAGLLLDAIGLVAMFLAMGGGMALVALAGLLDRRFRHATLPA